MTGLVWWDALSDGELRARLEQRVGPVPPELLKRLVDHREDCPECRGYLDEVLA